MPEQDERFVGLVYEVNTLDKDERMALTISHTSALRVTRTLRANGKDLRLMSNVPIAQPSTWVGKRWSMKEFLSDSWKWDRPSAARPLHFVTTKKTGRIRLQNMRCHLFAGELPANAVVWLDECSSMSGPEYLFVQMAESLSIPELVLLGYELCGNFTRSKDGSIRGSVTDGICPATSVAELYGFVWSVDKLPGIIRAREAVQYISNHAVSVPEAILATMYSLPPVESGYGMGPVTLNQRVSVADDDDDYADSPKEKRKLPRVRYPDLMFSFAPVGINYDGGDHLDLDGLVEAARKDALTEANSDDKALTSQELREKLASVRAKVVDDIQRNRQLASRGRIVFPATKEDLYEEDGLETLTQQILSCAHKVFGVDVGRFEKTLNDTAARRSRRALLSSMLP